MRRRPVRALATVPVILVSAAIGVVVVVALGGRDAAAVGLPGELHEVPRLTWLTPGLLPPAGLLTVGAGGSRYHPGYNPTGGPAHYDVLQGTLFAHWSVRDRLAVSATQHVRAWSRYLVDGQPESGSGLADGAWRAALGAPGLPGWLGVTVWGGGNLPIGSPELGEDAFSPEAGATLTLAVWQQAQVPQMRLHASVGRRWNGNETVGFGAGLVPAPQPWYPQYPAAPPGDDQANDFFMWSLALEFRQRAASLWVEWTVARLPWADGIGVVEDHQMLAAGVLWGLREGWALHADMQVGLWKDDLATAWYPRQPHQVMSLAVSRQFAIGRR